jgi:hypothetical protein
MELFPISPPVTGGGLAGGYGPKPMDTKSVHEFNFDHEY